MRQPVAAILDSGDLSVNARSSIRGLRAENIATTTEATYLEGIRQFAQFLQTNSMPLDVADIEREHVEHFIGHLLETRKPSTAETRYRALNRFFSRFFSWLVEEEEIETSPMAKMKPPKIPEDPLPVIPEEDLRKLLGTREKGKGLEERRDTALFRVFIDTGARRAEVTNLRWMPDIPETNDVDLDQSILRGLERDGGSECFRSGEKP